MHQLEQAATGGHVVLDTCLVGCVEESRNGRLDRALKHWIIAAKLGCDNSSEALTHASKAGVVSKENFGAVLIQCCCACN